MRALATNHGFTISICVAVAITTTFANVFEASEELVVTLLVLGIRTAVAEYFFLQVRNTGRDDTTLIECVSESGCGQEVCR